LALLKKEHKGVLPAVEGGGSRRMKICGNAPEQFKGGAKLARKKKAKGPVKRKPKKGGGKGAGGSIVRLLQKKY